MHDTLLPTASSQPSPPWRTLDIVYLGISGVLHPSVSTYELANGRSPWDDGHMPYESAAVLESALSDWPNVRIVLTSTLPWRDGLEAIVHHLGPALAARVISFSYRDLTVKAKRTLRNVRTGVVRLVGFSDMDYWRMNKSEIVAAHVSWFQPRRWIAVDDEDILWEQPVREKQLVLTDGCEGLREPATAGRLRGVLARNFDAS